MAQEMTPLDLAAYPKVITEDMTLRAVCTGISLARFSDGEMHILAGEKSPSQPFRQDLQNELRRIAQEPGGLIVAIPNIAAPGPRQEAWKRWLAHPSVRLFDSDLIYGSAFVNRPDSAPWINRPDYWEMMRRIWEGRHVALVAGSRRSLMPEHLLATGALTVDYAASLRVGAYDVVDEIEGRLLKYAGKEVPVIICLGAAGTCLAHRLSARGVWAIDLGHVGMFLRRYGVVPYFGDDLGLLGRVSPDISPVDMVLNRVEPECLTEAMGYLFAMTTQDRISVMIGADGPNGLRHRSPEWWEKGFQIIGWKVETGRILQGESAEFWLTK